MELNKYTKQCKYVIAVLQINSHGFWLPVVFHLYFNSTITEVLKKHWRSGADMQGTATEMMLVMCPVAIFNGHLQHTLNDCSSTRILHLLPDFSTLVYSVDGSARQPPFQWLRAHTPCERTIVLTSRTLLWLHQRVHVTHLRGTVNSAATRTHTGFTKVRLLERTMKPSTTKLLAYRVM